MAILDALKDAANVLREADKIPQYQAVLDAYSQIAELQAATYSQQLKIQELTGDLERIRRDQKAAEGAQIWMHLLWIPNDHEPYCVHCFDKEKRLFHVTEIVQPKLGKIGQCPECKAEVTHVPRDSFWNHQAQRSASTSA
jgi:hypothetical protein